MCYVTQCITCSPVLPFCYTLSSLYNFEIVISFVLKTLEAILQLNVRKLLQ